MLWNLDYYFDQLESVHSMKYFPSVRNWLLKGGKHPLIILQRETIPFKLLIRSFSFLLLLIYALLEFAKDWFKRKKVIFAIQIGLLLFLSFILIILPTIGAIIVREKGNLNVLAHDGGTIQIEEAVKVFLRGKNPYSFVYKGTPLENWRGFFNPAIYHYPYFPLSFIISIPFYLLFKIFFGFYDQRMLYILAYFLNLLLALKLSGKKEIKLLLFSILAFNPFMNRYFFLGTNDIVTTTLLLLSFYYFKRNKPLFANLFSVLSVLYKQFIILFIPFFLSFTLKNYPLNKNKNLWKKILLVYLFALLFIGIFFIISPGDFIEDVYLYNSGNLKTSYPIQGFHGWGIGNFLLFFKIIPSGNVYFPFWIFQIIFALPLLIYLLFKSYKGNYTYPYIYIYGSIFSLFFLFFARYLNLNFIAMIIYFLLIGIIKNEEDD